MTSQSSVLHGVPHPPLFSERLIEEVLRFPEAKGSNPTKTSLLSPAILVGAAYQTVGVWRKVTATVGWREAEPPYVTWNKEFIVGARPHTIVGAGDKACWRLLPLKVALKSLQVGRVTLGSQEAESGSDVRKLSWTWSREMKDEPEPMSHSHGLQPGHYR